MGSVATLIGEWLTQAWVGSSQFNPSVIGLKYFNEGYHRVKTEMTRMLNERFELETRLSNIVANTWVYALPTGTSTINISVPQLRKLMRVEVKYTTNQVVGYKATPVDADYFVKWESFYESYRPAKQCVFTFEKENIRLFPTPTVNVTNGLKIRYEPTELDLLYTDNESAITIPWKMQFVIPLYIKYKIYDQQQYTDKADRALARFQEALDQQISALVDRYDQPLEMTQDSFMWLQI